MNVNISESKSYDEILNELKGRMAETGIPLLESDPAAKILEIVAFRELLLRERINNAAKANLLAFSTGQDLDYLAEFYGVERKENEDDEAFRLRVKARIAAFSTAGTKEHYRFHALSASTEVKDALASTSGNGLVRISILSNSENGEASEELLETVRKHIMRDDVKMLTDTVEIVGCHIVPLDIVVEIKFANSFVSDSVRFNFIEKFNSTKCLGWNPSISWIIANLFTDEVTHIRVISPEEDVQIASDECISLNSLEFV